MRVVTHSHTNTIIASKYRNGGDNGPEAIRSNEMVLLFPSDVANVGLGKLRRGQNVKVHLEVLFSLVTLVTGIRLI